MPQALRRVVKTPGAILMGLGSIVGTGLFVSIAIATQIGGNGVVLAIIIAAITATLNGLSSAQLAANFPVSGGTYEYGYRVLGPLWGFTAGWMFLLAKSASAATAALGCAGYLFFVLNSNPGKTTYILAGLVILLFLTILVSRGIRRSNTANSIIVSITLAGLGALILGGLYKNGIPDEPILRVFDDFSTNSVIYASALMFVAYTGYGRIATLGEEVVNPQKTIPRAIILSMICIVLLYLMVTLTALQALGAESFGSAINNEGAPIVFVAQSLSIPGLSMLISIAAVTAMAGVLLNLILGLSRVMLSMARRNDLPKRLSDIEEKSGSPVASVWVTGLIVGALVLTGDIRLTWTFSAFTVLIYYAITNLSAFLLKPEQRLYPRWVPAGGFISCLTLAFWIEPQIWGIGIALIVIGLIWHRIRKGLSS